MLTDWYVTLHTSPCTYTTRTTMGLGGDLFPSFPFLIMPIVSIIVVVMPVTIIIMPITLQLALLT